MRKVLPVILLIGLLGTTPVYAFKAGGVGKVGLNPATPALQTGTETPVDVFFNTANTSISGVSVRLTFTVPASPDLQVVRVQPATLEGWAFAVNSIYTSGGKTTVDLMALNTSTGGYTNNANTKLATVTFKAISAFSGKAITFDQTQTKMLKKTDASDILGTLTNGTFSATGQTVQAAITPTATPTTIPAATATQGPTPTPVTTGDGQTTPTQAPTLAPTPTIVPLQSFIDIITRVQQPQVTPTPTPELALAPSVTPAQAQVQVTVNPFYDANRQAPAIFTVTGTTLPYASVNIQIQPDGVLGVATADANGNWQYTLTKPLSSGPKTLDVTVLDVSGARGSQNVQFMVAGAAGVNVVPLIGALGLVLLAVIFFLLLRSRRKGPGSSSASVIPPAPPV